MEDLKAYKAFLQPVASGDTVLKDNEVLNTRDGKVEYIALPPDQISSVTYPSEWFSDDKNKDKKPIVKLDYVEGFDQSWFNYIYVLRNKKPAEFHRDEISMVLRAAMIVFSAEVENPVTTYGFEYKKGTKITPSVLCTLEDGKKLSMTIGNPNTGLNDEDQIKMLKRVFLRAAICCRFSYMNPKTTPDLIKKHMNRLESLISAEGKPNDEPTLDESNAADWVKLGQQFVQHPGAIQACAIIDMFVRLQRKVGDKFGCLAFSTTGSYGAGCSAVNSLSEFMKKNGLKPKSFYKHLFHVGLADDYSRIFKKGNEVDVTLSYTYYGQALGLMTSSPYSAAKNINLFVFLHLIGLTQRNNRSYYAQCNDQKLPDQYLDLAMICSLLWKKNKRGTVPAVEGKADAEKLIKILDMQITAEEIRTKKHLGGDEIEDVSGAPILSEEERFKKNRYNVTSKEIQAMGPIELYGKFALDWGEKAPRCCKIHFYSTLSHWDRMEPRPNTMGSWMASHLVMRSEKQAMSKDKKKINVMDQNQFKPSSSKQAKPEDDDDEDIDDQRSNVGDN